MELNSVRIEVLKSDPIETIEVVEAEVKKFLKRHTSPVGLSQTQIQQLHKLQQSLLQEQDSQ